MTNYNNIAVDPLSLMEHLTSEAVHLAKIEMDTTQEVALYEQGIRLIAKAWKIPHSYPEELLEEIEQAKSEMSIPADLKYRSAEATQTIIWNLFNTLTRLDDADDQRQLTQLISFAADYPEPLLGRGQERKEGSHTNEMTFG